MFRFSGGLTLSAVTVALAWAALKAPDYRSPNLEAAAVAGRAPASPPQLTTTGEMLLNAEWFDLIFRGARQDIEPTPRPRLERPRRQDGDRPKLAGGTYRTVCVRLCDGFYFPISYSTRRQRFAGDAAQCEQRCPYRSRLFVHRNPGRKSMTWSTSTVAPIAACPPPSCTGRNMLRTAPAADVLGRKTRLPGIVLTLRTPRSPLRPPMGNLTRAPEPTTGGRTVRGGQNSEE